MRGPGNDVARYLFKVCPKMIKLSEIQVQVRQMITRKFLDDGYMPPLSVLARAFNKTESEMADTLRELAANKALVLHPHVPEVWIAHPFCASPNSFWVEDINAQRGWWSNCTWCAMGVAALVKRDVRLYSRWGGEAKPFLLEIIDGVLCDSDFVVHMAQPVVRLWDNVIFSCSLMLPHRSADQLTQWCERHQIVQGAVLPAEKCWELSKKWYGSYLDDDWNRKSAEEVREFFDSIGLDLDFQPLVRD